MRPLQTYQGSVYAAEVHLNKGDENDENCDNDIESEDGVVEDEHNDVDLEDEDDLNEDSKEEGSLDGSDNDENMELSIPL